jgi:hypothetical protein
VGAGFAVRSFYSLSSNSITDASNAFAGTPSTPPTALDFPPSSILLRRNPFPISQRLTSPQTTIPCPPQSLRQVSKRSGRPFSSRRAAFAAGVVRRRSSRSASHLRAFTAVSTAIVAPLHGRSSPRRSLHHPSSPRRWLFLPPPTATSSSSTPGTLLSHLQHRPPSALREAIVPLSLLSQSGTPSSLPLLSPSNASPILQATAAPAPTSPVTTLLPTNLPSVPSLPVLNSFVPPKKFSRRRRCFLRNRVRVGRRGRRELRTCRMMGSGAFLMKRGSRRG